MSEMLSVTVTVDWLSVTAHMLQNPVHERVWGQPHKQKEVRGSMGYDTAYVGEYGVRWLLSSRRRDMGYHVIYSGKVLNKIEEIGIMNKLEILRDHILRGHKLVRLDVAVDVMNSELQIGDLWYCAQDGKVKTRAKSFVYVVGNEGGETLYIGSRKKRKKLLRIYNKAAEQGIEGDWIRIELQLMNESAQDISQMILAGGSVGDIIIGAIRGFCDFDNATWEQVMNADSVKVASIKNSKGDTQKWLMEKVLPTLVKECVADYEFWIQWSMKFGEGFYSEKDKVSENDIPF